MFLKIGGFLQVNLYFLPVTWLRRRLEVWCVLGFFSFFRLFPYPASARFCGKALGRLAWVLSPRVRRRSLSNLQIAFPDYSSDEVRALARTAYDFMGRVMYEFIWSGRVSREELVAKIEFEPTGLAAFERAYAAGKGVVFVTGHLGNWEILSHALVLHGFKLNAYAAVLANDYAHRYVEKLRTRFGAKFHAPRMITSPDLLRALKRGEVAGFVADQNAGGRGLFVRYMGQLASTHKGPASYAAISRVPIFFGVCLAKPDGTFRVELIDLGAGPKKDLPSILRFTARWVGLLEKYVRKYPEQYFWMHHRWKSRPGPDSAVSESIDSELEPYA
ncbi:MAG: hypothetical protein K8S54_15365 [Spirochaetia bacterium]|nr:hypothetical protein [Spirochaetia bacterium]